MCISGLCAGWRRSEHRCVRGLAGPVDEVSIASNGIRTWQKDETYRCHRGQRQHGDGNRFEVHFGVVLSTVLEDGVGGIFTKVGSVSSIYIQGERDMAAAARTDNFANICNTVCPYRSMVVWRSRHGSGCKAGFRRQATAPLGNDLRSDIELVSPS